MQAGSVAAKIIGLIAVLGVSQLTHAQSSETVLTIGESGSSPDAAVQIPDNQLVKLQEAFAAVTQNYPNEITPDQLINNAIRGMVTSLDAYSDFYTPQEYQRSQETIEGENANVGLVIEPREGQLVVLSTLDNSSAREAEMAAGDILLSVNGRPALAEQLDAVRAELIGEPNTTVDIRYVNGFGETIDTTLTRQTVELDTHEIRRVDDIVIIRIGAFNETTVQRLEQEILAAKADGVMGYIIDLRNNPGGLINQAISMADLFLDGRDIVSTQGKQAAMNVKFQAESGDLLGGLPLMILVNKGSASASEIVAGALQHNQRAMIAGQTTFGKASIQSVVDIGDSQNPNGLKLTIGHYYLPNGEAIERKGITPDVMLDKKPLDADDLLATLSLGNELENVDTSVLTDTELQSLQQRQLDFFEKTDPNLSESIKLMQALLFSHQAE